MMDLGATICTSRTPRCLLCPLSHACEAYAQGEPERFPVKAAKAARPTRQGKAFWIEHQGAVWLTRRPGKGMLGGMRALPDDGWSARQDGAGEAPITGPWQSAGAIRHVFTHFALDLHLAVYSGGDPASLSPGGEWWPISRLDEAGLPTLFAKAAQLALATRE
jgi:A/G-specific adenine glycosylase